MLGRLINLADNESPFGPSTAAIRAYIQTKHRLHRYPEEAGLTLRNTLARFWRVLPENVTLGNGSCEIIDWAVRLFAQEGDNVLLADPGFPLYERLVSCRGARPLRIPWNKHSVSLESMLRSANERTSLVLLCNPHNPSGTAFSLSELTYFLRELPKGIAVLLDEAYAEYARNIFNPGELIREWNERPILVTRTFSKAYGLASLRIGYGLAKANIIAALDRVRLPYNTSAAAQAAATAALGDSAHLLRVVQATSRAVKHLMNSLRSMGMEVCESETNFILVRIGNGDQVAEELRRNSLLVKSGSLYGIPEWIRVSAGLPVENSKLLRLIQTLATKTM